MTGPLQGIRVLDLTLLGPGPHCSKVFADLGADVLRVVEPGPGTGRRKGRKMDSSSGYGMRRNTRVIGLNLKILEGREILYKLVTRSDVMLVSSRPTVYRRLGVDYDTVKGLNPRLVYCSVTGYGATGPYAEYAGHDINYQSLGGSVGMTGRPDDSPVIPGGTFADGAGGMAAAIGILAALVARERTETGQGVDVSCAETIMDLMAVSIDQHLGTGDVPERGRTMTTGQAPYYSIYRTRDGRYVSVGAIEPWFFENLCRELGCEELAPCQHDERKQTEIFKVFKDLFLSKTRDEWVAQLASKDTCVAPVYTIDEVVQDPQFRDREMVVEVGLPEGGTVRQVGIPYKFSNTPPEIRHVGPRLGDYTAGVLKELGYTTEEAATLKEQGVVA